MALCGLALAAPAPASADYTFVTKWGGGGSGDGQFRAPAGITTDTAGNVYVSEAGNGLGQNDRVQKFNSGGAFITKWGTLGTSDTQFTNPLGIATDSANNVYVADSGNAYIKKFDSNGLFLTKIGGPGMGDGQFSLPTGVVLNTSGQIYATDHNNSPAIDRVEKFIPDGLAPCGCGFAYNTQWGVNGTGDGQFHNPWDVAVGPTGDVYVTDQSHNRIEKFDPSGFFLTKWGGPGSLDGQFGNYPQGIATDPAGNVYVADTANNRIQVFNSGGGFIGKFGSTGAGDGQFLQVSDVTVDASGNIYTTEGGIGSDRVQKFCCGSVAPPSGGGGGGGPSGGPSNVFTIIGAKVITKDGKVKYQLVLPGPGTVDATATAKVIGPPRPPSLDPDQRRHEGHNARVAKKKKKTITVAKASVSASAAGPLTLTLTPSKLAKKYLRYRTLKTSVKITYKPTGGTANSLTQSVTFKLAKKKRKKKH